MKKLFLLLLFPFVSISQTDTIFVKDKSVIVCKITLVNNYNIFYTERKVGKYIELQKVISYVRDGKRKDTFIKEEDERVTSPAPDANVHSASPTPNTNLRSTKTTRTKVITKEGFIVKNNREDTDGAYPSDDLKNPYMFAVKQGCATQVISEDSVKNSGKELYVVDLYPVAGPAAKNVTNKIMFAGFIDKTEKIRLIEYISPYQYTFAKLNGSDFKDVITNKLNKNGFKAISDDEDVFQQKDKRGDLALAGEIIYYEKGTRGTPGVVVSVVVKWTLFDVVKQENVCKIITGGYSNTQQRQSEKQELLLALADAAGGLINNKEVQRYISGNKEEKVKSSTAAIEIPEVSALAATDNYIQNAIQSAVTIQSKYGHGSGFLISSSGYILTNYHVIKDSTDLQVIFQNDLTLPLQIISYDSKVDVALCKVPGKGYKPMPMDTNSVVKKIGSDVVTIGTPEDIRFGQTVTKGIISGLREIENNLLIQTDVSINPGNSGGMLINKNGEVIGIVVSKIKKEGIEGIGFAIPVNEALKALSIKIVK